MLVREIVEVEIHIPRRARRASTRIGWWPRWRRATSSGQPILSFGSVQLGRPSFAPVNTGCLALGARRRLLRRAELELCANGEGAGAVVAEGLVERILYALGFDLSEAWHILKSFGGLSDSCEALVEDSQQPYLIRHDDVLGRGRHWSIYEQKLIWMLYALNIRGKLVYHARRGATQAH